MPAKKSKYKKLRTFVYWFTPLVFILGIGSGYLIWGLKGLSAGDDTVQRVNVSVDDDPSIGPADAPVTIIEFGDFQCGYCKKWHDEVFGQLMTVYSGKIRFVFRDFPLADQTIRTLAAANCAEKQGRYWEYHAAIFSGQYGYDLQAFFSYATDLNLDGVAFSECLASDQVRQEIISDYNDATRVGVQSTPTFFINGIPVVGAQSFAAFKEIIDKELQKR